MIPLAPYDFVRLAHMELDYDLERFARLHPNGVPAHSPIREYNHAFGEDSAASDDDESGGGGGGIPAPRSRLDVLRTTVRSLTTWGRRPLPNPLG